MPCRGWPTGMRTRGACLLCKPILLMRKKGGPLTLPAAICRCLEDPTDGAGWTVQHFQPSMHCRADEVYRPPWNDRGDGPGVHGGPDDGYNGPAVRHSDEDRWGSASTARRPPFFRASPGQRPRMSAYHALPQPPAKRPQAIVQLQPLLTADPLLQVRTGLGAKIASAGNFRLMLRTQPCSLRRQLPDCPNLHRLPLAPRNLQTAQSLLMWILSGRHFLPS